MEKSPLIHEDFLAIKDFLRTQTGLEFDQVAWESESQDYSACTFQTGNKSIHFRKAKITPKKIGQFVTFWKRTGSGPIAPYDLHDSFDLLVVGA